MADCPRGSLHRLKRLWMPIFLEFRYRLALRPYRLGNMRQVAADIAEVGAGGQCPFLKITIDIGDTVVKGRFHLSPEHLALAVVALRPFKLPAALFKHMSNVTELCPGVLQFILDILQFARGRKKICARFCVCKPNYE